MDSILNEAGHSGARATQPLNARWAVAATGLLAAIGIFAGFPAAKADATTLTAVFPPWWTQAQVWRAASSVGDIVDTGGARFVLVLHSNLNRFSARARAAGALLVLDPSGLGACGPKSQGAFQ
jgi:hypothetical protein